MRFVTSNTSKDLSTQHQKKNHTKAGNGLDTFESSTKNFDLSALVFKAIIISETIIVKDDVIIILTCLLGPPSFEDIVQCVDPSL